MYGKVIWLFGLSGSGKTTLGKLLAENLGFELLDSDRIREELDIAPDFGVGGRLAYQAILRDYIRREYQLKCVDCVVASITPLQFMRDRNREELAHYFEVYLDCNMSILKYRDPKGLYKKACSGEIQDFTGISSPFEPPDYMTRYCSVPQVCLDTGKRGVSQCYKQLIRKVNRWITGVDFLYMVRGERNGKSINTEI